MNGAVRHLLGYSLGIFIFLLLIPCGLYQMAQLEPLPGWNPVRLSPAITTPIAIPVFIVGIWFMLWSNLALFSIGKGGPTDGFGVAVSPRTKKLVITGPYRHTRNPMVFGAFSLYLALALFLQSGVCLLGVLALAAATPLYLKATEEKRLLADFGDEYRAYAASVPMIVPIRMPHRHRDRTGRDGGIDAG